LFAVVTNDADLPCTDLLVNTNEILLLFLDDERILL